MDDLSDIATDALPASNESPDPAPDPAPGPDGAGGTKDRVLHARISEALDDEIKGRARALGVSVSNLVRHSLKHTLGLVEDVVVDTATVARVARGEELAGRAPVPPARRSAREGDVVGWQRLVLARNAICDRCNAILAKGSEGALGVRPARGPAVFRCTDCLERLEGLASEV